MIPQRQQALSKEQGSRWPVYFLCLWLAIAYLWLAIFYPLIRAPYSSISYISIPLSHTFDDTPARLSTEAGAPIVRSNDVTQYLRSSVSVSSTPWPVDAREDTSELLMSFIDGISLPDLSWLKPAQPLETISLLHTELYKQFRASPPEQPPRLS